MATRVEVKGPPLGLSEPRERVSESRLSRAHISPLTDSSNKAPELGPGALILPEEGSKPAQTFSPGGSSNNVPSLGPKPRLTPKPFALEKAPIMRPIAAPKPAPKPSIVPGKLALTPSGPAMPSESRTAEPPKPAALPKTRTLPETEYGFTQIEPLRVTLYETFTIKSAQTIGAGQQERPSAETRLTEDPRPEGSPRPAERTAQPERRLAAFPGSSLSRAKSMGFLDKAAVDQDSEAGKAVGSEVPDSQAYEPRVRMRSKARPVSAMFPSPGNDCSRANQGSEPPSQAEKPWLRSPRPLSMDLTAKFEAIGLSQSQKSGRGLAPPEESKENMPAAPRKHSDTGSRGEKVPELRGFQKKEPTDAPGKKAEKVEEPRLEPDEGWSTEMATWEGERETGGQEVTVNRGAPGKEASKSVPEEKPLAPIPAAAPSPSLALGNSQVTKREEENRAPPSGGNIKRRISLLLESSLVGMSSSPGAESSPPATPPSATEVINVGIKQRIKELKVDMPEAKPEPQRRSYQPRPRSSDLTKRFSTEAMSQETLSSSPATEKTATEMEGMRKGPERENQDQYRKTEDPSPSQSEQIDSKFPEFSWKSMKSTRPVPENLPSPKPEVVNQVPRKGSILGENLPQGPECESLPQASEQQQPVGKKPDSKARDDSYFSFQTVRASLFENYVVKQKVMEAHIYSDNSNPKQENIGGRSGVPELDQGQSPDSLRWERERERSGTCVSSSSSESFRRSLPNRDKDRKSSPSTAALRDEPSLLVTREVLPKCVVESVRVDHVFDTIQAVSEKAVSESVPVALEDKAMTLRSRRPAAKDTRDSESPSVQSQGVKQQPVPGSAPKWEPVPEISDKRELSRNLPAEETQSLGASRMNKSRIRTEDSMTDQQAVPERVKVPREETVRGVADDRPLGSRWTRVKPDEGPAETKQPSRGAKYLRVGSLCKWRAEALKEKDEYFKKEAPPAQRGSSLDAYNWSSSEKKPRRSETESAECPSTTETHSLSKGEARTFKQEQSPGPVLSTQGKTAVSEFEEFSRVKENEYPSQVPPGDHSRAAASVGKQGTSLRTREDRLASSGAEDVVAPKSLKTTDQGVGLKQRGNTRLRDTPPKEKRKDSEPRATYFALTGQMPDYPLESLGSKTTQQPSEGTGVEVAFDDFSVKSYRRWGSQGQVLKRNPSLEAAYGKLKEKDLGIEDAPKSYERMAVGGRSDEAGEETGSKSQMRRKVLNQDAVLYERRRDIPESEKPAYPDPQSNQPPQGSREMEVDGVTKWNAPTSRAEEGYRMGVQDTDALTVEYKGMSSKVTDPWQRRLEEGYYPLARTSRGSSQPSTDLDSPTGARTYAGYQPSDLPKPEPQKPTGFVDSYSREEGRAKPDSLHLETTRHSPLERNSSRDDVPATSRSSEEDWRRGYRRNTPKPSGVEHLETVRDSDRSIGRGKRVGYAVDEALDSRLKQRVKEPSGKPVPSQSARLENDWYIPRASVSNERHGQESRSRLPKETAAPAGAPYEADARRQSRKKEQELEPHYPEPRKQGYLPAQDSPVAPAEPSRGRQSFPQESGLKRSKSMHRPRALTWGEKKDSSRERSKSSPRKSFGAEDTLDGVSLIRMRAHSMNRERTSERGADQLKQCITKPRSDSKDTDTLVQEADSQYGTWDTGLRTDDSLTPATPTESSSPSLQRQTPDRDSALSLSSSTQGEFSEPVFPDPTSFLDSSALKTRVQLSKKRIKRTLPSRTVRLSGVPAGGDKLSVLPENTRADDWMFKDSTEEKAVRQIEEEEEEEERPRRSDRSPAWQPQRVPLFPGMDPSALKAQLRKRTDSDSPAEGSPSSQLPKSPFSQGTAGCRVLPSAGGKENGSEEMSPQWMKELKSKKRLSQYESNP
ncbi:uncharacterized protein KIAA1671-like isoform X2 [Polyodon spathula]|uniref:uncharacterized protein KIAA1671-like isoform X2 n=1 Tax=Polyodon spathula TaxID=7913 RepID=UPI001B7EEFD5|nr:uncharacterized protein KIAA1671-like isoform X2 [Polyodon spathula]